MSTLPGSSDKGFKCHGGCKGRGKSGEKEAYVEAEAKVTKEDLTKAVVEAGYEVVSVE